MRCAAIAIAIALVLALTGCYESPGVTISEPGTYKGQTDPLLAKLKGEKLQNNLEARFQGQTDR